MKTPLELLEKARKTGLRSISQILILAALYKRPLRCNKLAEEVGVHTSNIGAMLDHMESLGLLGRKRVDLAVTVHLSPQGRALIKPIAHPNE